MTSLSPRPSGEQPTPANLSFFVSCVPQQMVWVEGRHLPQQIALSDSAQGIELVD